MLSPDDTHVFILVTERPSGAQEHDRAELRHRERLHARTSRRAPTSATRRTAGCSPSSTSKTGKTVVGRRQLRPAGRRTWTRRSARTARPLRTASPARRPSATIRWSMPVGLRRRRARRRQRAVRRQQGPLVRDARSGDRQDAASIDTLHDDAWVREIGLRRIVRWTFCPTTSASGSSRNATAGCTSTRSMSTNAGAKATQLTERQVGDHRARSCRPTERSSTSRRPRAHPGRAASLHDAARRRRADEDHVDDRVERGRRVSPDESTLGLVLLLQHQAARGVRDAEHAGRRRRRRSRRRRRRSGARFKWIDPKVITYKARDGVDVYARLFTPEMIGAKRDPTRPAVVFVHGAGYLQNAHKYWSTYFREYMFHNLLASTRLRRARHRLPRQLGLRPRLAHRHLPPHGRQGPRGHRRRREVPRAAGEGATRSASASTAAATAASSR